MQVAGPELRRDALQIWQAGVEAVRAERLVREWLRVESDALVIGNRRQESPPTVLPLGSTGRIVVVGGGKAGAGMARAIEEVLGPRLMAEKQLTGWVNVPADCARAAGPAYRRPLNGQHIHLHAARPAGVNEPTVEGVAGSEEILRLVESLGPNDLCLCLISGGGSALMPAPVEGITLADKIAITRHLSAAGANIEQLNTVRKQLSRIKGGGLWRACRAGRLAALVISDVLGDRLDLIASGPTVPDCSSAQAALDVLDEFHVRAAGIAPAVFDYLQRKIGRLAVADTTASTAMSACCVGNFVIGNNATAVAAAADEARRLGYAVVAKSATQLEGAAEEVGRSLAERAIGMRDGVGGADTAVCQGESAMPGGQECLSRRCCLVSGGEPVVTLVEPSRRGLGGRNQQLVLAALLRLVGDGAGGIALLSGGTDGEDGPTDAAGAVVDAEVLAAAGREHLDPADYLARDDAYHFFARLGALIKTGPTQTNVCDVRVVTAEAGP